MRSRQTLYEMLGVAQTANPVELQAAYQERAAGLEAARARLSPDEFKQKAQLLRLALSTLSNPVTRTGYDAKLSAQGDAAAQDPARLPVVPVNPAGAAAGSADIRADALSLRADALALRADAMLVRAGIELPAADRRGDLASAAASGAVDVFRRVASALGLLVMVGICAFAFTRCTVGDPAARRELQSNQATEKAALQDYYQTHGVRPANMAELELLEADRRRRENLERNQDLNRDKQERQEQQFERESRRRAEEVSWQLRSDEEHARREARRQAEQERQDKLQKQEEQRMEQEAERQRIEREQARWREELRR